MCLPKVTGWKQCDDETSKKIQFDENRMNVILSDSDDECIEFDNSSYTMPDIESSDTSNTYQPKFIDISEIEIPHKKEISYDHPSTHISRKTSRNINPKHYVTISHFDNLVIQASYLLKHIYKSTHYDQQKTYMSEYLFITNILYADLYLITIDTALRMIYKITTLINDLQKQYSIKNIYIINDLPFMLFTNRSKIMCHMMHKSYHHAELLTRTMTLLYKLSECSSQNQMYKYTDIIESCKEYYPECITTNSPLYPIKRSYDTMLHKKWKRKMMIFLSYSQMHFDRNQRKYIFEFVLEHLPYKIFNITEPYKYDEPCTFKGKTLCIQKYMLDAENTYMYYKENIIKSAYTVKFKPQKLNPHHRKKMYLYDLLKNIQHVIGTAIYINPLLNASIFRNFKRLFVKRVLPEPFQRTNYISIPTTQFIYPEMYENDIIEALRCYKDFCSIDIPYKKHHKPDLLM